jgi:hypothetical protein
MPRTITPAVLAALLAPDVSLALMVEIGFRSGSVYIWSGLGDLSWNGHTWKGLGTLMGIAASEDAATVEARGISILLSGLDPALLADCQGEFQPGLPATVYLAVWSGGSIIPDPLVTWAGRTDQPTIDVQPDMVTIAQACESRLSDMNVAVDRRLTHLDQQMDWPGDLGLQFVDAIQEMTLFWGFPTGSTNI